MLSGRKVNDGMGEFVVDAAIKQMILSGKVVCDAKVVILGLTFKENCPDTLNSKVADIINRLKEFGVKPIVVDSWASERDTLIEYGVELVSMEDAVNADCVIVAVVHNEFRELGLLGIEKLFKNNSSNSEKVLIDVKGVVI